MSDNAFKSHELTEMERLEGFQVNAVGLKMMDNHISECAHQILNLTYRPSIKEDYMLALRFAQGQINAIKYFRDMALWMQNGKQGDEPTLEMPVELA